MKLAGCLQAIFVPHCGNVKARNADADVELGFPSTCQKADYLGALAVV